jgi:hypothetical protein
MLAHTKRVTLLVHLSAAQKKGKKAVETENITESSK